MRVNHSLQPDLFGNVAAGATCSICGRPLSDPASIARGIGPVCAAGAGLGEADRGPGCGFENICDDVILSPAIADSVVFGYSDGRVWSNVPHFVCDHSATGYAFGYGGSGPADLALNIAQALCILASYKGRRVDGAIGGWAFDLAWSCHQELKWAFVAGGVPRCEEGASVSIATADLLVWLDSWKIANGWASVSSSWD